MKIIGSTKEKSYLFKNEGENKFYFFYDKSENCALSLKNIFDNNNLSFINVKINEKLEARNILIKNNIVIGWCKKYIYLGLINNGEIEIIQTLNMGKKESIKYVSLNHHYLMYNDKKNYDEYDEEQENIYFEEELYKKKKDY